MAQHHAIGIVVAVRDVGRAVAFFESALEMPVRTRGEGFAVVDNGSISLRLVEGLDAAAPVLVEVTTKDVKETARALGREPGVAIVGEIAWVREDREEQRLTTPHGVTLVVARDYNEDEIGVVPPLPTKMPWADAAIATAQGLLAEIPVSFRTTARTQVTSHAEYLTAQDGEVVVEETFCIRAFIQLTPAIKLDALRQALADRGFDAAAWEADFER